MYNRTIDDCLCIFESVGDILVSGEAVRCIWYDRCYFGRQTYKPGRERSINAIYGVARVVYRFFCVISHPFTSSSVVGAVRVKMDRLPPESQEQLKKTGIEG